eukprot:5252531-Pleurochrysis_carterae.AAC.1
MKFSRQDIPTEALSLTEQICSQLSDGGSGACTSDAHYYSKGTTATCLQLPLRAALAVSTG